jgi:hypothetical protein
MTRKTGKALVQHVTDGQYSDVSQCVFEADRKDYLIAVTPTVYPEGRVLCHEENRTKQTPWPLVCERTIPTERTPLSGEI